MIGITRSLKALRAEFALFAIMVLFIPMAEQRLATAQMHVPPVSDAQVYDQRQSVGNQEPVLDFWIGQDAHDKVLLDCFGIDPEQERPTAFLLDDDDYVQVVEQQFVDVETAAERDDFSGASLLTEGVLEYVSFNPLDSFGDPIEAEVVPLIDEDGILVGIMQRQHFVLGGTLHGDFGSLHLAALSTETEIIPIGGEQESVEPMRNRGLTVLSIEDNAHDAEELAHALSDESYEMKGLEYLCKNPDPCVCAANQAFQLRKQACKVAAIGPALRHCIIGGASAALIAAVVKIMKWCGASGVGVGPCTTVLGTILLIAIASCIVSYIADAVACILNKQAQRVLDIAACQAKRAAQPAPGG